MTYRIEWDFNDKYKRYWTGFGAGYTTESSSAKVCPTMKQAEIEADKIHKSRKQGASVRPWE